MITLFLYAFFRPRVYKKKLQTIHSCEERFNCIGLGSDQWSLNSQTSHFCNRKYREHRISSVNASIPQSAASIHTAGRPRSAGRTFASRLSRDSAVLSLFHRSCHAASCGPGGRWLGKGGGQRWYLWGELCQLLPSQYLVSRHFYHTNIHHIQFTN